MKKAIKKEEINPFVLQEDFKLKLIKIYETSYRVNPKDIQEDGIVLGDYEEIKRSFLAEAQSKTSVYYIPYIENVLFKNLSSASRDLLLYIIYNIGKDTDIINLKYNKVCEEMLISKPTLNKAIKGLEASAILFNKCQSEYWVNPYFIFNGNRISYYSKFKDRIDIVKTINKKQS